MRSVLTTIAAVATLVLVVKVVVASNKTAGDAQPIKVQNAMSIYDLHAGYPDMKRLATERTPQP